MFQGSFYLRERRTFAPARSQNDLCPGTFEYFVQARDAARIDFFPRASWGQDAVNIDKRNSLLPSSRHHGHHRNMFANLASGSPPPRLRGILRRRVRFTEAGASMHEFLDVVTTLLLVKDTDPDSWQRLLDATPQRTRQRYQLGVHALRSREGAAGRLFAGAAGLPAPSVELHALVREVEGGEAFNDTEAGGLYEWLIDDTAMREPLLSTTTRTPPDVVDVVVKLAAPRPAERVLDPAAREGALLAGVHGSLGEEHGGHKQALGDHRGTERVPRLARAAAVGLMLRGSSGSVTCTDPLSDAPPVGVDLVVSCLPTREGRGPRKRSAKQLQLDYLRWIASSLGPGGRAAVTVTSGTSHALRTDTSYRQRALRSCVLWTCVRRRNKTHFAAQLVVIGRNGA